MIIRINELDFVILLKMDLTVNLVHRLLILSVICEMCLEVAFFVLVNL